VWSEPGGVFAAFRLRSLRVGSCPGQASGSALMRWDRTGNELPALEKLMVGGFDRCYATILDFTPEVMRLGKPHRELKWEIPVP